MKFLRLSLVTTLILTVVSGTSRAQAASGMPVPASSMEPTAKAIPFHQLGAEAQKQYEGGVIAIEPTATGARLRAVMQDLEGEVTEDGLWLTSTADEDAGKSNRFRVRAMVTGRRDPRGNAQRGTVLGSTGTVHATSDAVIFTRPGMIEEYKVSTDGVRQDFVLLERPAGYDGALNVMLVVTGAAVEAATYGAKLTVCATGRELAYSRLKVTDATGKELSARMVADAVDRLRVEVEDAAAVYPIRIDPTFSDADWVSMGGLPGTNGTISAMIFDGSGNLFIGGDFTAAGNTAANGIAKWNGST
jgi:hypothetical protein